MNQSKGDGGWSFGGLLIEVGKALAEIVIKDERLRIPTSVSRGTVGGIVYVEEIKGEINKKKAT